MAGSVVIKRLGGRNARRKFNSEIVARSILSQMGVEVVPVLWRLSAARIIVMPRVAATLNRNLSEAVLRAYEDYVLATAGLRVPPETPPGYFWIDAPHRIRSYPGFVDFLVGEFQVNEAEFRAAFPAVDVPAILALFDRAGSLTERTLILNDIAPKNVVYVNDRFENLDLEATLIGPPEFLLVKAVVNLATDIGDRHNARDVRQQLLAGCGDEERARAVLAWTLTRRMLHESRADRRDARPEAALQAVLDGRGLNDAISHLEASWDAEPTAT